MNPTDKIKPRRGLGVRILIALLLVILIVTLVEGVSLYLRFGPVALCPEVPINPVRELTVFRPDDPDAGEHFGSHARLACPESPRSYMEWYAMRVHFGEYFMDVLFETRGVDQEWGVAGFGIWDRKTFRPVSVNFELGDEGHWAATGADVRLSTLGPRGKREESFFRYLDQGSASGSFELMIYTERGELHLYFTPLVPGAVPGEVGTDRTRPGSWYQYQCVSLMGRVEGEIKLYPKNQPPIVYRLPASVEEPAFAYCEHMWGQADRTRPGKPTRYYWDWGNWGRPDERSVIFFSQVDGLKDIVSFVLVCVNGEMPFRFLHDPPRSFARNVYSRLADSGGHLYPQALNVWAFAPGQEANVNAQGFVRSSFGEWQAFDLWGRAGDREKKIDWSDRPVWSVNDFYKGAQVRELIPPPVSDLRSECEDQGCRVNWKGAAGDIEYWVFRQEAGRMDPGAPVAVVGPPPGQGYHPMSWQDPAGRPEFSYKVVSVRVPQTLLHDRFHAGYERTSAPLKLNPTIDDSPLELRMIYDGNNYFTVPPRTIPNYHIAEGDEWRVDLKPSSFGDVEFRYQQKGQPADKSTVLPPRFTRRTQIQSAAVLPLTDNLIALAWTERTPIMDSDSFTDWEAFVSFVNPSTGAFRVVPVSMSDDQDLNIKIERDAEPDSGHNLVVSWSACRPVGCREATQKVRVIQP